MALYSIEITAATKNPKALVLIAEIAGLSVAEVRLRMKQLPLLLKDSIPLSEAVALERQLRRLGLTTQVRKMAIKVDDGLEEVDKPRNTDDDDLIIIPETEVRVLSFQDKDPPQPRVTRKILWTPALRRSTFLFTAAVVLVLVGVIYMFSLNASRRLETDLDLEIGQWSHTLNNAESLLDKGHTPKQILAKLEEIEGKINHLIGMLKSRKTADEYKGHFNQIRQREQEVKQGLEFRRRLENSGYPIHPNCFVEQGMVRGASDLPQGTFVRVQLFGAPNAEQISFPAQINEGIFRVLLDPVQERTVFDAVATVAPLSQQPPTIQKWAKESIMLDPTRPLSPQPETLTSQAPPTIADTQSTGTDEPQAAAKESAPSKPPSEPEKPPTVLQIEASRDSLADAGMVTALQKSLDQWSQNAQEGEKYLRSGQVNFLESLFQRLLSLEAQIDHMIHQLATDAIRNQAVLKREETYGAGIGARQDLQSWHDNFLTRSNPLYLETALHRRMASHGFPQIEVTVVAVQPGVFEVNIRATKPETAGLYAAIAASVADEINQTPVKIQIVKLFYANRQLAWTPDHLLEAAEALKTPHGQTRCAEIMEKQANKR